MQRISIQSLNRISNTMAVCMMVEFILLLLHAEICLMKYQNWSNSQNVKHIKAIIRKRINTEKRANAISSFIIPKRRSKLQIPALVMVTTYYRNLVVVSLLLWKHPDPKVFAQARILATLWLECCQIEVNLTIFRTGFVSFTGKWHIL